MADNVYNGPLIKSGQCRYTVPITHKAGMHVPGVVYADGEILKMLEDDAALEQVANVACLPGIVGASYAMPDIHPGYGFAIGGVAATSLEDGVISPGGVGYDINCGVRLLVSDVLAKDAKPWMERIVDAIFKAVPSGVGTPGPLSLTETEAKKVLKDGAKWAVENGYGTPRDTEYCEENGRMSAVDPAAVSKRALSRGLRQLGTLGSGNHFIEVGEVSTVLDTRIAKTYNLNRGRLVIMIHTGSRGLGHQVCSDHLRMMTKAVKRYSIDLVDRQLACAPVRSEEGKRYFAAMAAAANYAWANRQVITHLVREAVQKVLGATKLDLLYDVCHNIAKIESHKVEHDGQTVSKELCVHRKGATRAFGPNHPDIPKAYRESGQPVFVPGDMGRRSYVMAGTESAMSLSFGSCCHGAGRVMSRSQAKGALNAKTLREDLLSRGIVVRAASARTLVEEASDAYKDVSVVVDVAERAGLGRKVARLKPLGVIKG